MFLDDVQVYTFGERAAQREGGTEWAGGIIWISYFWAGTTAPCHLCIPAGKSLAGWLPVDITLPFNQALTLRLRPLLHPFPPLAESNAAANKLLTASALPGTGEADEAAAVLQPLVDNNVSTCYQLQSPPSTNSSLDSQASWVQVDLNYVGIVGSVAVAAGDALTDGLAAKVHVTQTAGEQPSDGNACSTDAMVLQAGEWTAASCNKAGR